jgi:hypothetical protein
VTAPPAFQSRARVNRRCRDEEVLLHLFFKDHNGWAREKQDFKDVLKPWPAGLPSTYGFYSLRRVSGGELEMI